MILFYIRIVFGVGIVILSKLTTYGSSQVGLSPSFILLVWRKDSALVLVLLLVLIHFRLALWLRLICSLLFGVYYIFLVMGWQCVGWLILIFMYVFCLYCLLTRCLYLFACLLESAVLYFRFYAEIQRSQNSIKHSIIRKYNT